MISGQFSIVSPNKKVLWVKVKVLRSLMLRGAFQDKCDFIFCEDRWINFYDIGGFFQISGVLIKIKVLFNDLGGVFKI